MPDHLAFSEHMTSAPYDGPLRQTYLGQAHIAGTGPEGTTCRECIFWKKTAFEAVIRVLVGGSKPSKSERDYLVEQLRAAAAELRGRT